MAILVVCRAIDLKLGSGCTPAWWQLFKNLCELGEEIVVIPLNGNSVESLWWRCAKLPSTLKTLKMALPSLEYGYIIYQQLKFLKGPLTTIWHRLIHKVLSQEESISSVIFFGIPSVLFTRLPYLIKKDFGVSVVYYEPDMAMVMPKYGGFYSGIDLSGFDAFISNSKGAEVDLKEMGATRVYTLYWGADPTVYNPIKINQDIDVSFYGHGSNLREEWMRKMITYPSKALPDVRFVLGGKGFNIDLGLANHFGPITFSLWRYFCCRSKINLNITRKSHSEVYASATSRLFELASLGCCIVSNPIEGLNEWFDVGKEIFVAYNEIEATELYKWLLSSDDVRTKTGNLARNKLLKEHTFKHRAQELREIILKL